MRSPLAPFLAFLGSFVLLAWLLRGSEADGKFASLAVATMVGWWLATRVSRQQR